MMFESQGNDLTVNERIKLRNVKSKKINKK